MKLSHISAIALLIAPAAVAEGMQAQCGPEVGKGLTTDPRMAETPDGWFNDRITGGETLIRVSDNDDESEVRFKDARGTWRDSADDGGVVMTAGLRARPPAFMVAVIYTTGVVETYMISDITDDNQATLIHTATKLNELQAFSRVMKASCKISFY